MKPADTNFLSFIAGLLLGVFIAIFFIFAPMRTDLRTQAVNHGAAEWVVHPDGSTEFKWKESKP